MIIFRRRTGALWAALMVAAAAGLLRPPTPIGAATETGSGPWHYGTDLIAQAAATNNGGSANNGFSSSTGEIAEECTANPPTGTTACGRGEFGGPEPFSATIASSLDSVNSSLSFACPSSATAHGSLAAASNTPTGGSSSGKPPATVYFPGNFPGGKGGDPLLSDNISGDMQCYSPYVTCAAVQTPNGNCSAVAPGSNTTNGSVYPAAPTDSATNCTGTACLKRSLATAAYIAPTSPDGNHTAGTACSGHILLAGGEIPTTNGSNAKTDKTAELYDPRVGSTLNEWTSVSNSMGTARDSAAVSVLNDGRILIAGGETTPASISPTNAFDVFDPTTCTFETIANTMNSKRYDFSTAMFTSGTGAGAVLACGGDDSATTITSSCELFTPSTTYGSGGTWATKTAMSQARSGSFAQTLPSGTRIVEVGGNTNTDLTKTSEECDSTGCNLTGTVLTYANDPNYPSPGGNPRYAGKTITTLQPVDSSHVLIGGVPSGSPSNTTSSIAGIAGSGATASNFKGLVLECGGFGFLGGSSSNIPTNAICEYYLPSSSGCVSGTTQCSAPTGVTCSASSGPAWCAPSSSTAGAQGNIDLQRERAYFFLQEVPKCQVSTDCPHASGDGLLDRALSFGGYYGVDNTTCSPGCPNYLTRKNVEYLVQS